MIAAAVRSPEVHSRRDARLAQAINDQRAFLHRIPDPDTRERAEGHLILLMEMREKLERKDA